MFPGTVLKKHQILTFFATIKADASSHENTGYHFGCGAADNDPAAVTDQIVTGEQGTGQSAN
jgi:hypothetical protein